jgi:hypothetical protein
MNLDEIRMLDERAENIERWLRDLLAVIHRDGGHYTEKHGLEKSTADAHAVVCEDRRKLDEALFEKLRKP